MCRSAPLLSDPFLISSINWNSAQHLSLYSWYSSKDMHCTATAACALSTSLRNLCRARTYPAAAGGHSWWRACRPAAPPLPTPPPQPPQRCQQASWGQQPQASEVALGGFWQERAGGCYSATRPAGWVRANTLTAEHHALMNNRACWTKHSNCARRRGGAGRGRTHDITPIADWPAASAGHGAVLEACRGATVPPPTVTCQPFTHRVVNTSQVPVLSFPGLADSIRFESGSVRSVDPSIPAGDKNLRGMHGAGSGMSLFLSPCFVECASSHRCPMV